MKYEDLTDADKYLLGLNGCGSRLFKVPNFFFEADCLHHDYGYWIGCTSKDRKNCDLKFYQAMNRDVEKLPWYRRYHYITAFVYYSAVRYKGGKYFYYGEKKREYTRNS